MVHVDESELVQLLLMDFGGSRRRAKSRAAARALRAGDAVPLLRLAAETRVSFPPPPPEHFSAGLNVARFCTDQRFQWDPMASPAERARQFEAARAALDRRRFAPFSSTAGSLRHRAVRSFLIRASAGRHRPTSARGRSRAGHRRRASQPSSSPASTTSSCRRARCETCERCSPTAPDQRRRVRAPPVFNANGRVRGHADPALPRDRRDG